MNRACPLCGVVTFLAAFAGAPAHAQEMAQGTWTGTIAPPGAPEAIPVMYEVGRTGDALSIVMTSLAVEGEMAFRDVRIDGAALTFWWEAGPARLDCSLARTAVGGYQGTCSDGSGPAGEGALTMLPPGAS